MSFFSSRLSPLLCFFILPHIFPLLSFSSAPPLFYPFFPPLPNFLSSRLSFPLVSLSFLLFLHFFSPPVFPIFFSPHLICFLVFHFLMCVLPYSHSHHALLLLSFLLNSFCLLNFFSSLTLCPRLSALSSFSKVNEATAKQKPKTEFCFGESFW